MPGWLLRESNTFRTIIENLLWNDFVLMSENKCLETTKSDK